MLEITNNNFDKVLADLSDGLTLEEHKRVNKVGDKIYERAMQQFLDSHKSDRVYKKGTEHLADTLTHEIKDDGSYEIGFSKKGKKAYVARLLNDGWRPRNQHGGPYGTAPKGKKWADWHDFITNIGRDHDEEMGMAMAQKASQIIDDKMRGK